MKHLCGYLTVSAFPEEPSLCPMNTIIDYAKTVQGIRGDNRCFFVSFVSPHKSVSSQTLARWMTSILEAGGVDTTIFSQHATRAATVAHLRSKRHLNTNQICKLADWSEKTGVFQLFYDKFVVK